MVSVSTAAAYVLLYRPLVGTTSGMALSAWGFQTLILTRLVEASHMSTSKLSRVPKGCVGTWGHSFGPHPYGNLAWLLETVFRRGKA